MKPIAKLFLLIPFILFDKIAISQVPVKVVAGKILIDDGTLVPKEARYKLLADTLDRKLTNKANDTTSLFYRALLLDRFNDQLSKPAPGETGALENLQWAKRMVDRADSLNMHDFKLKLLRAQICKDLTYCFGGDESWKYNTKQIAERRSLFNKYKALANGFYDELASIDQNNAYDYQKQKITYGYPIKE